MADFDFDDDSEPRGPSASARARAWLAARTTGWRSRATALGATIARPRTIRAAGGGVAGTAAVALLYASIAHVHENEVGVVLNNLTGDTSVLVNAGLYVLPPVVTSFYRLDRRVQTLQMTEAGTQGFAGGDAVGVKTSDGSNVALDLQASFRLVPERADVALRTAGTGTGFADLWVRSQVRAAVATEFGKLTTEQVYDADARKERSDASVASLNQLLGAHGVEIVAIVVQDFRFYKEYEEIIKKKKLADQEVEEQQAQARLATEDQQKELAAANFAAEHDIGAATATAEQTRATADGYDARVRLEGEGARITGEKTAQGLLATGLADAAGMKEQAAAVGGEGGVNMVALQYARKMKDIKFTGVPVLDEAHTGRFKVQGESVPAVASASPR